MDNTPFMKADEIGRRQFLADAARKYLGVTVAPMLGASLASPALAQSTRRSKGGGQAEHVIFLNMSGGMSHIDTFDIKNKKEVQGPVGHIGSAADYQISEFLPKTAAILDKACVINSMTSKQGAHRQGQYQLRKSYAPRGTIQHPTMGSWVVRLKGRKNLTLPGFVTVNGDPSPGFFGAEFGGVPLGRPSDGLQNSSMAHTVDENAFTKRLAIADAMNQNFHERYKTPQVKAYESLYDEAVKLMKSEDLKAFDLDQEDSKTRQSYGKSDFSQGCLLARRLVEAGVRFVEVRHGSWDTHYDNFAAVESRARVLDEGYAALMTDLDKRGLLAKTLVVISTEFGRTPRIVQEHSSGRDHHPSAFSTVVAGGGIKGGERYGSTDSDGNKVKSNPVTHQDLNATMAYALGLNHKQVVNSPSGRPFRMGGPDAEIGSPITSIFG